MVNSSKTNIFWAALVAQLLEHFLLSVEIFIHLLISIKETKIFTVININALFVCSGWYDTLIRHQVSHEAFSDGVNIELACWKTRTEQSKIETEQNKIEMFLFCVVSLSVCFFGKRRQ
jgi:hypothetical protein